MTTANGSSQAARASIAAAEREIEQALSAKGGDAERILITDFIEGDDARRLAMFSALLGRAVVQHLRCAS